MDSEDNILTFNYVCLFGTCRGADTVHITKLESKEDDPEYCEDCNAEMKCIGIKTSIAHKGTQESKT